MHGGCIEWESKFQTKLKVQLIDFNSLWIVLHNLREQNENIPNKIIEVKIIAIVNCHRLRGSIFFNVNTIYCFKQIFEFQKAQVLNVKIKVHSSLN